MVLSLDNPIQCTIKVVFAANLGTSVYTSQVVELGGVYPKIEIVNCDTPEGLHKFKIAKTLPNLGNDMIASAVADASHQIEVFWNVLAYVRDSTILPLDVVEYEHGGRTVCVSESTSQFGRPSLQGLAGESWFAANAEEFHKNYDYDLLKRFNFGRALDDPVSRFLALYALLSSAAGDEQSKIDELIASVDPTVGKSISPRTGKPETLFTRLRNELAHHRAGATIFETHREIELHVGRFAWVVGQIMRSKIRND